MTLPSQGVFFPQAHKTGEGLMLIKTITIKDLIEKFPRKSLMVKYIQGILVLFAEEADTALWRCIHTFQRTVQVDNE